MLCNNKQPSGASPGEEEAQQSAQQSDASRSATFCKILFDCENFIAALFCQRGGSILPQTHQDKEETGCVFFAAYCCLLLLVPLAEWQLLLTSYPAAEPGLTEGALTLQYPEGRDGSCQNSHLSSLLPWGVLLQLLPPRGPRCTLLLISSISSLEGTGPRVDAGPPFLTSAIWCTFEVPCKC